LIPPLVRGGRNSPSPGLTRPLFGYRSFPSLPRGEIDLARSAHAATVARFCAMVIVRQAPISWIVRKHPMHSPFVWSKVQTLIHGEAT